MIKTTKKQLRHNKKKKATRKKHSSKKVMNASKTYRRNKKRLNLKNRTLKKLRGGAGPESDVLGDQSALARARAQNQLEQAALQAYQSSDVSTEQLGEMLSQAINVAGDLPSAETMSVAEEVAEDILEDPDSFDYEMVDTIIPASSNKKTIKQRLMSVMHGIKNALSKVKKTFKRRPKPAVVSSQPSTETSFSQPSTEIAETSFSQPSTETSFSQPSTETSFSELSPITEPLESQPSISESSLDIGDMIPEGSLEDENERLWNEFVAEMESSEMNEDEILRELDAEYELNMNSVDEETQDELVDVIGRTLNMEEPTEEKIKTEITKEENKGVLAAIVNMFKKLFVRKSAASKKPAITTDIQTKLKTEYPELKTELDNLRIDVGQLYDAVINNRDTTQRIFENFKFANSIKDEQKLKKLSEMLDSFHKDVLSSTIEQINQDTQGKMEVLNNKIETLTQTNTDLKQIIDELREKAAEEQPVIVERIVERTPADEELKKLHAVILTNNDELLLQKIENEDLRRQMHDLIEMARNNAQELESLKALRESHDREPWVYGEKPEIIQPVAETTTQPAADTTPTQPAAYTTPTQPAAYTTPTQPAADTTPTQPVAETTPTQPAAETSPPPPYTEKVINVEPKELLDNKSIVIRIVMPRGAQIIASSDTGNSAEEGVSEMVKMIGGGSLNPATLHPASLF
jgi:hypothetical protein